MSLDCKAITSWKVTNYYPLVLHGKYNNRWRGCVDCGIDKGAYSKGYSAFFDSVVSIDALIQPEARDTLQGLSNVTVVNQCLYSATGDTVTFYEIVNDPALNTLSKAFLYHNLPTLENAQIAEHKLTTTKLDDVDVLPAQIDFLKIDCEGSDAEILVGANNIIKRCRPTIVTEQNNTTIDRLMRSHNYERFFFDEEYCIDAVYFPSELIKK